MAYRLEFLDEATREALVALGSVFLELRHSRSLSQRKLASRCGLSQSSISRLETGKAPSLSAVWIARMLACLDIEPGTLGLTERPTKDPVPSWRRLRDRFESIRRHREYNQLIFDATLRRQEGIRQPQAGANPARPTDAGNPSPHLMPPPATRRPT